MEVGKNSISSIFGIFNKLSIQQRLLLGGIFVVSIILLGFVLFIFNEPTYSTLYTNLAQEDASKVVDYLSAQKVPYRIENNGQTIRVPKDKMYELRLSLAGKGIPNSGIIGYEIFDKNTMGMSEFMQKLNFKRALEGEIAKTIMQQNGVEGARVHIVFPEKSVFRKEEKQPTASVVLNLSSGEMPSQNSISAISNLVASSVEGLKPSKVTILDTKGRLLSREEDENSFSVASGKQYEIKGKVESYLAGKAQSMLDNVLGYGNSIVKVNIDLDFKQIEKTIQSFDPESQIAISEQTVKSQSNGRTVSDTNAVVTENSTTNYEISKTIERVIEGAGNIKRITVATVINGTPKVVENNGINETVFEPRSEEQLLKLEEMVKQAVGFNEMRKDQFSTISIPFENQVMEKVPEEEVNPINELERWSNFLLIFVAIGASLFVIKGLMKRLRNEKIVIGSFNYSDQAIDDLTPSLAGGGSSHKIAMSPNKKRTLLEAGDIEDEITDEAQMKKMQHEKIVNYVTKNPSEAAKLINSWLREDEL